MRHRDAACSSEVGPGRCSSLKEDKEGVCGASGTRCLLLVSGVGGLWREFLCFYFFFPPFVNMSGFWIGVETVSLLFLILFLFSSVFVLHAGIEIFKFTLTISRDAEGGSVSKDRAWGPNSSLTGVVSVAMAWTRAVN